MLYSYKYCVGLTGGIGSGKSTISKIFEVLGIPVYNSDQRAKDLINQLPELIQFYTRIFGDKAYINGKLNRDYVAGILFENKHLLSQVEEVVHPSVRKDFKQWCKQQPSSVVMNEAAILFESGGDRFMNDVITVTAPLSLRITRIMNRDGVTREQIMARITHQWSDEKKAERSRYIIHADDHQLVIPQVLKIYHEIRLKAGETVEI